MLSASKSQRRGVELLLAGLCEPSKWFPQRNSPGHFQLVAEIPTPGSVLASGMARIGCVFEIEEQFERFLFHPGLGIHRQAIDEAGEIILRADQVSAELRRSAGNLKEFERRLRLLQGIAWLDMLEPYRLELMRYDQLPRAV